MAAPTPIVTSEWDDVPHDASELFGGDFFGDDLMEMYTADAGLNLGDSAAPVSVASGGAAAPDQEGGDESHPGILVAMHAAAMDGGLSPLGSTPEFVPLGAPSEGGPLPPYPNLTKAPAAAPAAAPAPAAAKPPAVTSAPAPAARTTRAAAAAAAVAPKRPLAAPAPATKKQRTAPATRAAPVAAPATRAVATRAGVSAAPKPAPVAKAAAVPAKLAPAGGVKVPAVVPKASAPATRASIGRVVSSSSVSQVKVPATAAPAAAARQATAVVARPTSATLIKKAPVPAPAAATATAAAIAAKPSALPLGGGINHQVVVPARPAPVPSSAVAAPAHTRLMPPKSHLPAASRIVMKKTTPLGTPCPSTGVIRAKSEADFKDVASAAVSSLIQNASNSTVKAGPKPLTTKPGEKPIDVSTAHINALTSQNWVTACNPVPTPDASVSAAAACDKAARNARRAALTQEERAKQNRDRNREHARNTRLRKKAYVEELKRTLTELVAQRDAADLERRHEAQRNREQREVRFRVMEEFLKLRGRNEANSARWVAILEDGFTFTLPRTNYRRMVDGSKSPSDVNGAGGAASSLDQVLRGAAAVMEDSKHLAAYLQTVGPASSTAGQVQIVYSCDRKKFFMDSNIAFMDFTAATHGAVAKGAPHEATFKGTARASFSPASNKLISVDVTFDSAAFLAQVEAMSSTEAAAAVAAHEADALLDSLQMPQIFVDKKAAAPAEPVSVSSDDGERSTDGSAALHA